MTTMSYKDIKPRKHHDVVFPIVNAIFLILLMFVTLYPVINTLAYSFNDGTDALKGGIGLWPRVFSLKSYQSILSDKVVYQAAWISASKTVIITILNLFWTGMLAYTLTRREYVLRRFITIVMVLTMYVNAGLIPNYLLITKTLHLNKSYWVYIVPTMFSCFNMIVLRTYIAGLPEALVESARIDGAGDIRIYWQSGAVRGCGQLEQLVRHPPVQRRQGAPADAAIPVEAETGGHLAEQQRGQGYSRRDGQH